MSRLSLLCKSYQTLESLVKQPKLWMPHPHNGLLMVPTPRLNPCLHFPVKGESLFCGKDILKTLKDMQAIGTSLNASMSTNSRNVITLPNAWDVQETTIINNKPCSIVYRHSLQEFLKQPMMTVGGRGIYYRDVVYLIQQEKGK